MQIIKMKESRFFLCVFFFSSRRRHTRCLSDWSSDVCSSDLDAHEADFEKRLSAAVGKWKAEAASLGLTGMKVVTYHRSWSYFAKAYGLQVVEIGRASCRERV